MAVAFVALGMEALAAFNDSVVEDAFVAVVAATAAIGVLVLLLLLLLLPLQVFLVFLDATV